HAAGALIAREAGGYVKMLNGEAYAPTLTDGSLLVAPDRDSWMALADLYEEEKDPTRRNLLMQARLKLLQDALKGEKPAPKPKRIKHKKFTR
ncbi:hypothetical protein AB9K37_02715, partial [Donghicola sp. XS_ASV15]